MGAFEPVGYYTAITLGTFLKNQRRARFARGEGLTWWVFSLELES